MKSQVIFGIFVAQIESTVRLLSGILRYAETGL